MLTAIVSVQPSYISHIKILLSLGTDFLLMILIIHDTIVNPDCTIQVDLHASNSEVWMQDKFFVHVWEVFCQESRWSKFLDEFATCETQQIRFHSPEVTQAFWVKNLTITLTLFWWNHCFATGLLFFCLWKFRSIFPCSVSVSKNQLLHRCFKP